MPLSGHGDWLDGSTNGWESTCRRRSFIDVRIQGDTPDRRQNRLGILYLPSNERIDRFFR
jgi:hypothetical protein